MPVTEVIVLLATGFLAGILGGYLGIGGGIILMPVLRFIVGLSAPLAAGTCIMGVFFTTLGGSYRHFRQGNVGLRPIWPILLGGGGATLLCSFLFPQLARHGRLLDLGIGLVFSSIAIRMMVESISQSAHHRMKNPSSGWAEGGRVQKGAIGALGGIFPGLLGIGTGVVLVPTFKYILRMSIKSAMATSLACFCFNAFLSATTKLVQGFVDLQVALPICIGTLSGANLGAILNKRSRSRTVKFLFGLLFAFISLKFVLAFFGGNS
jgi:uncharacterized membrane protein YfcA